MTTKRKLGQCQVENCTSPAKYGTYRTKLGGSKEWLYVCPLHEEQIGDENVLQADSRHGGGV